MTSYKKSDKGTDFFKVLIFLHFTATKGFTK